MGSEHGHIIFLGAPGVGKGTQAKRVANALGLPHVSTGDMLRASVNSGSEIGRKARAVMESGALVSDEIILGIVAERLQERDAQHGVVFDGFPRTVVQGQALDDLLAENGGPELRSVLHVVVADDEVVDRLSGRRVCSDCGAIYHIRHHPPVMDGRCDRCGGALILREDDQPEVIRKRLAVYRRETEPLVAFYCGRPGYSEVDGGGTPEAVAASIAQALGVES